MKERRPLYALGIAIFALMVAGASGLFRLRALVDDATAFTIGVAPLAAALFVPIAAAIYVVLKRNLRATRPGLVLCALLVPLAFALLGLLVLANEKLDASDAAVHEARLIDVYDVRHGAHRHRYAAFESWRGRASEVVWIDADTYALGRRTLGKPWRVRTHPGSLGYAWIESMAPARQ